MATVNRYTNIQPARYNPRSLQELMIAPKYKREQHDAVQEGFAGLETALAKVDPLDVHSDIAKMEQQKMYDQITQQADILNTEGFSPSSKSGFLRLNKEYQKAISPTGTLGRINTAKTVFAANKKAHIDQAVKEGFSPEAAERNWNTHASKYEEEFKKTGAITPIGSLGNPLYVNGVETAMELFKDAGFSETDIASNISNIVTQDPRGQYILNKGNQKVTSDNINQLQKAVNWLNSNINNPNSDLRKSMDYEGKTPQDMMNEISGLADVYVKDKSGVKTSRTITGFKPGTSIGIPSNENINHETTEAKGLKVKNETLVNNLESILNGETVNKLNTSTTGFVGIGGGFRPSTGVGKNDTEIASISNKLNQEQREQYDKTFIALKDLYPKLRTLNPDSEEAISIVANHMKGLSNEVYNNEINIDDLVTNYGDRSVGIKSSTKADMLSGITSNRNVRTFGIDGKLVPFSELPGEIKQAFVGKGGGKLEYSGHYTPKNFLQDDYISDNKDAGANYSRMLASPLKLLYTNEEGEVKEIIASRGEGEMTTQSYKADLAYNNIYTSTKKLPGGKMSFPKLNADIIYQQPQYQEVVDPITKEKRVKQISPAGFIVNSYSNYGNAYYLTEEELQDRVYQIYGVTEREKK